MVLAEGVIVMAIDVGDDRREAAFDLILEVDAEGVGLECGPCGGRLERVPVPAAVADWLRGRLTAVAGVAHGDRARPT